MERPPKKRSSTIRLCCWSKRASPFNASSKATTSTPRILRKSYLVVEGQQASTSPAFSGPMPPRIVNQDLPHQLGGDRKEVSSILDAQVLPSQAHVSFVYQCRALQSMVGTFPIEVILSEPAQLIVDERDEGFERFLVS